MTFCRLRIEQMHEVVHIQPIPHVYLFRDEQPVTGFLGYRNREQVREWIDEQMERFEDAAAQSG